MSNGTITGDSTVGWTFTPTDNFNGTVELSYVISDGTTEISRTVSFEVIAINDIPNRDGAPDPLADINQGEQKIIQSVELLYGYHDMDEYDELTIAEISVSVGTLTKNGDNWNFSHPADYHGEVTVTFVVSDGNNGYTLGKTTFNINQVK